MNDKLHHFYYNRNKQSSKSYKHNEDYGQDVEPHGEYMNLDQTTKLKAPDENWETGTISFKNPLYLEHKDTSSKGWKKDLSEKFEGKTGKELSEAVKKAGHDAIITKDKYGISESINLNGLKNLHKELPRQVVTSENKEKFIQKKMQGIKHGRR
jgi:beta-mannanase